MAKQFRDEIAKVCHEMMDDLHKSGIVPDAEMRKFEQTCFIAEPASDTTASKRHSQNRASVLAKK